jgi:hypothetical protein
MSPRLALSAGLLATLSLGVLARPPAPAPHDPLAHARARRGVVDNPEAGIPPPCYTATGAASNPCWTCHTDAQAPNGMADAHLQGAYAFSEFAEQNRWTNLFVDRRPAIAATSDAEILAYVRVDNYAPLRAALADRADYPGWRPDLDLGEGFDEHGLARDGSGWRAYRYKPFPGAFWPTNGSAGDAFIRLPPAFRSDERGAPDPEVYRANLEILAAAVGSDPRLRDPDVPVRFAGIDPRVLPPDLDPDGHLSRGTGVVLGLPARYLGGAADRPVRRGVYPEGAEFMHSVRYLDPDAPGLLAARMKELRYMKKVQELDRWAMQAAYAAEHDDRAEGVLPTTRGSAEVGLRGALGWQLQGFIEDADGRLRLQTDEEHRACMGCHDGIGVTVDQTFSFPRRVPGADGWRVQDLRGVPDAPQAGHADGEILTYFRRVGAGDELRANTELLARWFPGGVLDEAAVRRARDVAELVTPSRARALALDKAYRAVVREQSFTRGRDAMLAPAANVHRRVDPDAPPTVGPPHLDARLQLDWSRWRARSSR